jgi:hypothetical protein
MLDRWRFFAWVEASSSPAWARRPKPRTIAHCFRNNASERFRPSSVNTSDFDLLTGSPIRPFLRRRSVVAKSKSFQAITLVVQRQPKQRENSIVDFVLIDIHEPPWPRTKI